MIGDDQHKYPGKLEKLVDVVRETVLTLSGTTRVVSMIELATCIVLTLELSVPRDEIHRDCVRSQQSPSALPYSL